VVDREPPQNFDPAMEIEIRRRVKEMRDTELVDFVRDTVTRLDALADRLEVFATTLPDGEEGDSSA
jgi:nitrogen-specific signal transduction histidine kinase